jgi:tetratricopeptide (TPR) repeat protein
MDAFWELCRQNGKDYYHRLHYVAGDRSERMLADAARHGVFAQHPGRYLFRTIDALNPLEGLNREPLLQREGSKPLAGVFLNYLLDCLPAAHLHASGNEVRQLHVRTCLARNVYLPEYTPLTPDEIVRRAKDLTPANERLLQELIDLMAAEYEYRPLAVNETMPYLDFGVRYAREQGPFLLHNYGAMQSLERLLDLLRPQGFILVNDYGHIKPEPSTPFQHQRFSKSTSVGLNFPLLKAYFADSGNCQWLEPAEENGHIYSRLLGHAIAPETKKVFEEQFGKAAWTWGRERWDAARAYLQHKMVQAALGAYDQAIERRPNDWILMNEMANFLTFQFGNPVAGIAMARAALEVNPACSPELWNTLGDAYYQCRKLPEAKSAYQRALRVNPKDVRGRYNMAWVHLDERDYRAALADVAEALALDETGQFYERLIQKQNEILGRLNQRNQHKFFLMANRVSSNPGSMPLDRKEMNTPEPKPPESPPPPGAPSGGS